MLIAIAHTNDDFYELYAVRIILLKGGIGIVMDDPNAKVDSDSILLGDIRAAKIFWP